MVRSIQLRIIQRLRSKVIAWTTSAVKVDRTNLEELQQLLTGIPSGEQRRVVYVFRYPSRVLYHFFRLITEIYHLPTPSCFFSTRTITPTSSEHIALALRRRSGDELIARNPREAKSLLRAFFRSLVENSAYEHPTIFIPVTLSAGNGPRPLPFRMSWPFDFSLIPLGDIWSLFVLLFYRRSLRLELGTAMVRDRTSRAGEILMSLSRALYFQEKFSRGAKIHEQPTVKNIVLSGNQFDKLVRELSVKNLKSPEEIFRKAERHFHGIEGTIDPVIIGICRKILDRVFARIFSEVSVRGIENLRSSMHGHPVILIPAHRSHLDYLLITYALHRHHLALPYIAAGDNLNFFPMGPVARRCGAFFIKRKLPDDPLYKLILDRYLQYLVKQGHTIEFFIEGGRSRDGLLRTPKLGLLKYLMRAILRGSRRDINFVPVSVNYERVAEDSTLISELAGTPKRRESLWQLGKVISIITQRFGPMTIEFSPGFSLRSALGERATELAEREQISATELAIATDGVGQRVMSAIESKLAITCSGITAAALLCSAPGHVSVENIQCRCKFFIGWIAAFYGVDLLSKPIDRFNAREFEDRCPLSPALVDALQTCFSLDSTRLATSSVLRMPPRNSEPFQSVSVLPEHIARLRYYRNTIVGKLLPVYSMFAALRKSPCTIDQLSEEQRSVHRTFGKRSPLESANRLELNLAYALKIGVSTNWIASETRENQQIYALADGALERVELMLAACSDLMP